MENKFKGILVPDVLIYNIITSIFKIIREDYINESIDERRMLYSLFKKGENNEDIKFEQFDYYKQAKEIFIDKTPKVFLGYNMEVSGTGCVHILLPNENANPLAIGGDVGYQDFIRYTDHEDEEGVYKEIFTQDWNTTFNLLITSENTFEAILIYNLLKASFLSLTPNLELAGFRLLKPSGSDLNIQSNMVPTHIFHRSLMINFSYEFNVPNMFYKQLVKRFAVTSINNENNNDED